MNQYLFGCLLGLVITVLEGICLRYKWKRSAVTGRIVTGPVGIAPLTAWQTALLLLYLYMGALHPQPEAVTWLIWLMAGLSLLGLAAGLWLRVPEGDVLSEKRAWRSFLGILAIFLFLYFACWAWVLPYNEAPDEYMRYAVLDFMTREGRLPAGWEPSILDENWGFSYAFYPMLTQIIGALFQKLALVLGWTGHGLILAARLPSVLCGALTGIWMAKLGRAVWGRKLSALILPILTVSFPQFAFMFVYINNDSLALMSGSMILYFWVRGLKKGWDGKGAAGLGTGIGLCALSYYNAYGFILLSIPVFYFTMWRQRRTRREILRLTGLILLVSVGLAGWWFLRNAWLYQGDFLARRTLNACAELHARPEFRPSVKDTPRSVGYSLWGMLQATHYFEETLETFIGKFGYLSVPLSERLYLFYKSFLVLGAVGYLAEVLVRLRAGWGEVGLRMPVFAGAIEGNRSGSPSGARKEEDPVRTGGEKKGVWDWCFYQGMLWLTMLIPLSLAVYYAYAVDLQLQGRYWLPGAIGLFFITTLGWDRLGRVLDHLTDRFFLRGRGFFRSALSALLLFLLVSMLPAVFLEFVLLQYL